ncbi:hypothetical protein L208DRAFT_1292526, partial [Tricholoma matsutake]
PQDIRSHTGFHGQEYELLFLDGYNRDNQTSYHGKAPSLTWSGMTLSLSTGTLAFFWLRATSNDLYFSRLLQSWNKFCFTGEYIHCLGDLWSTIAMNNKKTFNVFTDEDQEDYRETSVCFFLIFMGFLVRC